MSSTGGKTLHFRPLSDTIDKGHVISFDIAEKVFSFFRNCALFDWSDLNNNCEDRAEAISILLKEWNISSHKGWVLGGTMVKKGSGSLHNNWKYHVAAAVPVLEDGEIIHYIIDPATSTKPETLQHWADSVTDKPVSYFIIKRGEHYIFMPGRLSKKKWYERNRQNYKWTIQGLAGINGLSPTGKAYLSFNKKLIRAKEKKFSELRKMPSPFAT